MTFTQQVDLVYAGAMWCLCDCVVCEMEELILCEDLRVWGSVYAASVALCVYLGQNTGFCVCRFVAWASEYCAHLGLLESCACIGFVYMHSKAMLFGEIFAGAMCL